MNSKLLTLIVVLFMASFVTRPTRAQMAEQGSTDPLPRLELRSYRITLGTGIDLHYVAKGSVPPPGAASIEEAIILVHSYADSWRSFEEMLAFLPLPGYDVPVFALDMRGHGSSSGSAAGTYTQDHFADDIAAFMEALHIRKALVAGHSMGGFIAHKFVVTYPDKVKGLVLIATSASKVGQPLVDEMKAAIDPFPDDQPGPIAFVENFQASTFVEPPAPRVLHRYIAESLRLSGLTWKRTLDGMGAEDHRDQLPGVTVPTLILWGDRDVYFTREEQEELLTLLPDARLVIYPGAGHALNVERAAAVVDEMRVFVQDHFQNEETVSR